MFDPIRIKLRDFFFNLACRLETTGKSDHASETPMSKIGSFEDLFRSDLSKSKTAKVVLVRDHITPIILAHLVHVVKTVGFKDADETEKTEYVNLIIRNVVGEQIYSGAVNMVDYFKILEECNIAHIYDILKDLEKED